MELSKENVKELLYDIYESTEDKNEIVRKKVEAVKI